MFSTSGTAPFSPSPRKGRSPSPGIPQASPAKRRRFNMQEIAFAYGKEEKEVAISALQPTLPHGPQADLDEHAVWRATRAVVSVVINAAHGEGLFAREVLERAMATIFLKIQVGGCKTPLWKTSRLQCKSPEGWTMVLLLAAAAAQPNMDPALPAKWVPRGNLKGCFLPPTPHPTSETVQAVVRFALLLAIPPTVTHFVFTAIGESLGLKAETMH